MKLTEFLAIYAAILSSIVFLWNIARTIPRFNVSLLFGNKEVEGKNVEGVYVCVRNPSPQTVHLSNISIIFPYSKVNALEYITFIFKYKRFPRNLGWISFSLADYDISDECPFVLESGTARNVFLPGQVIEQFLKDSICKEFKAVVQDQLWRNKYSSKAGYPI